MGYRQIKKNHLNCLAKFAASNYKITSILLIAGLALILRIHHLGHESLWMDEIRQTSYYGNPLSEIIENAASQNQPPLDYWIGHFVHFLSNTDFAVRLPAALFGMGSVVLLILLISQISSWPVACGFGILAALMPFNLYYSQEARPYAIAVFLFLLLYWTLNRFLSTCPKKRLIAAAVLLILSAAFLHSRALSPLVVILCLILILVLWLFFDFNPAAIPAAEKSRLVLQACGALSLALLIYLPSLKFILLKSARMVPDTSLGLNVDHFISAVAQFDPTPLWQAYAVQSEPVTYPLLILVCLSPFFGWYLGLYRKGTVWMLSTLMLPIASLFNLLIFQSKSNMSFRPSYASYILPLACILGAVSIQGLWKLSSKVRFARIIRGFVVILAVYGAVQTLISTIDYKSLNRKSDWRGVAEFLSQNYAAENLLIFDALSHFGSWEPTYYGFPRYYRGRSPLASMARIPSDASKMAALPLTPVLILFHWREYYLTSRSPYPILSVPRPALKAIDYRQICRNPELVCTEFTGFSLIQLRETSKNLARDTYDIIEKLLASSPPGSWQVELHLAAAALARAVQLQQWQGHLRQAEGMVRGANLLKVKNIAGQIHRINPP